MSERIRLFKKFEDLAQRIEGLRVIIQNNPADIPIKIKELDRWEKCADDLLEELHILKRTTKVFVIMRNVALREISLCQICGSILINEGEDIYICKNPICPTNEGMTPAVTFNFNKG